MSPSRLAKSLMRRLRVTWREQPTQYDIEALEENVQRVGLVIRFRWMIVGALSAFSIAAVLIYSASTAIPRASLVAHMAIPAAALVFVLAYNTYYQLTYRYLGNVAFLNHAQLLFDIVVMTVLVHYSGGVYSWFYTMYALVVVEAAFIFPRARDTWLVTTFASVAYLGVLLLEFARVVGHVGLPLVGNGLQFDAGYVAVRFLWALTLLSGSTLVALQMMARVHKREAALSASSTMDEGTGLTNRSYFLHALAIELQRSRCYGQGLAMLLLDIDEFGKFNRRFGLEAGNRVLTGIARLLERETCNCPDCGVAELTTISRYGGEEFAIILPQPPGMSAEEGAADARALAERLCARIGALRVDDMGVTVSVGLALYPADGLSVSDLVASADQAVFTAAASGGNRVVASDDLVSLDTAL